MRIAGVISLSAALMGCAGSHEGTPVRDAGASDADDAQPLCDAAVRTDGACGVSPAPTAPDCVVASCTGALRWTRRLEVEGAGEAGAPRMRFTEVSADRGVVLNIENVGSARFAGTPLLTDANIGSSGAPTNVLVRLDAEGALVDRWPLPSSASANLITGHAESLTLLHSWYGSGQPNFSAAWPGASELRAYELPRELENIATKRERWTSVLVREATPSEDCGGAAGALHRLEHRDLRATVLLGRACLRTNRSLMQLEQLPSGGLAARLATGLTMGPPILEADFGTGRVELDVNSSYLIVWNADGSLRYTRPLGTPLVRLHVGGDDEVWALGPSASFRRFDARGELRTEGVTPDGGNPSTLRVDSAGNALLVGAPGPGIGTLRKISPEGKLIWRREVTAALDMWSLHVDAAGHSYLLSEDGKTLYQMGP